MRTYRRIAAFTGTKEALRLRGAQPITKHKQKLGGHPSTKMLILLQIMPGKNVISSKTTTSDKIRIL